MILLIICVAPYLGVCYLGFEHTSRYVFGVGIDMKDFKVIKKLVRDSTFCSISTTLENGHPHTSPIGSVFLVSPTEGYFIEMFTTSFKGKTGSKACIMAVKVSILFWIKSLIMGRFKTSPGIRLYVTMGDQRKISELEYSRFQKKVKPFKGFKGHTIMWSKASYVRPFTIDSNKPVSIGLMTRHLER